MAIDKLVDSSALDSALTDIADAIRDTGENISSELEFPEEFVSAIRGLRPEGTLSGEVIMSLPDEEDTSVKIYGIDLKPVGSPAEGESAGRITIPKKSKNLLPQKATSKTVNGITYTVNSDGTVSASGTATASAVLIYTGSGMLPVWLKGRYIINGNPSGSSSSTYRMRYRFEVDGEVSGWTYLNGASANFTRNGATAIEVQLIVVSGQTISTPIVFKPMIRLASISDDTYEPYDATINTVFPVLRKNDLDSATEQGSFNVISGDLNVDNWQCINLSSATFTQSYAGQVKKTLRTELPVAFSYIETIHDVSGFIAENYNSIDTVSTASALSDPDNLQTGLYAYRNSSSPNAGVIYLVIPLADTPSGSLVYKASSTVLTVSSSEVVTTYGVDNILSWPELPT